MKRESKRNRSITHRLAEDILKSRKAREQKVIPRRKPRKEVYNKPI